MSTETFLKIDLELPFASEKIAEIVYDVLRVDAEPKRSGVSKELSLEKNILLVKFNAPLARQLRVAVNGFLEKVDLVTETIDQFGPPNTDIYKYY